MSWRERLRPASFRGFPFTVDATELTTGRRLVVHKYPGRDNPYPEDMGREVRTYTVEAYIVGPDFDEWRDTLLAVFEDPGPGELVLPQHGTLQVVVGSVRLRQTQREGGFAQFTIEFVEAPEELPQPAAMPDTAGELRAAASEARDASVAEFLATYSPGVYLESVSEGLRAAATAAGAALATVEAETQTAARLRQRVDTLVATADSLVGLPGDLAGGLVGLVGDFLARRVALALYTFDPGLPPFGTSSNGAQERTNFDAVRFLVQRLAVAHAAELVLEETFASYEDAVAARESITDLVDDQAEAATDGTFPAFARLRAAVVRAVPGPGADLPRLMRYTPPVDVPSLVLAHRLHGDVGLELDLVARNRIAAPWAVPGGVEVEVLSRG